MEDEVYLCPDCGTFDGAVQCDLCHDWVCEGCYATHECSHDPEDWG